MDWQVRAAALLAFATVIVAAGTAHAEVRVNGDVSAIRIEAVHSSVSEVLSALGSAFQVRLNTSIALDRAVTGTFAGSLARILPRVLEGYNYVIKQQDTITEVTIVGTPGDRAVAVEPPRAPAARSLAAEWRGMTNNTALQNR